MSQKLAVDFLTENGSTVSKQQSSEEGVNIKDYRKNTIRRHFQSFPRRNITVGHRRQASDSQQIPLSDCHPSYKT